MVIYNQFLQLKFEVTYAYMAWSLVTTSKTYQVSQVCTNSMQNPIFIGLYKNYITRRHFEIMTWFLTTFQLQMPYLTENICSRPGQVEQKCNCMCSHIHFTTTTWCLLNHMDCHPYPHVPSFCNQLYDQQSHNSKMPPMHGHMIKMKPCGYLDSLWS